MAEIHVESQVHNASSDRATVNFRRSLSIATETSARNLMPIRSTWSLARNRRSKPAASLKNARFWSTGRSESCTTFTPCSPSTESGGREQNHHRFSQNRIQRGAGTGGVYINDKFVYLTGFAQRSSDEWAGLGQAYPDWMHDFNGEADSRLPRQLHSLDAHCAAARGCGSAAIGSASSKFARPATRNETPRAGNGNSGWK